MESVNSVFPIDSVVKDVPGHDIKIDVALFAVGHHLAPEGDLFIDGHLDQRLGLIENLGRIIFVAVPL